VPKLREHVPARGVNGIQDLFPAFDLLIGIKAGCAKPPIKDGWGRIINCGPVLGEAAPLPGVTLYVATKFAVQGFARGLSREPGPTGATVNKVQPVPIDTEFLQVGRDCHGRIKR
jgi:3-oxoacyl-[acyl-carrier protein] reductase